MPHINLEATTAKAARLEAAAYMREHSIQHARIRSHIRESITLSSSGFSYPPNKQQAEVTFQLEWSE